MTKGRVLRALAVLVVGLAGLLGLGVWWLGTRPIRLAFLDRPIAAAIGDLAPGLVADVGGVALVWSGWRPALQVSGLRLATQEGTPVVSLPELRVRPGVRALVGGRIVIARVDVDGADVTLTRRPDGVWMVGAGAAGAGVAVAGLLDRPGGGGGGAVALPRIALARTRLRIDDELAGATLTLADGALVVTPSAGRVAATLAGVLDLDSTVPPIRGHVHLPIQGEVSALLAADGALGDVDFTLAGDAGELRPGDAAAKPFALAGLTTTATWLPAVETLRFTRLTAGIGPSHLDAKATVILGAAPLVAFDGTLDALVFAELIRLWPTALAPAVRTWLAAAVRTGELRRCRVQLGLHPAPADAAAGATPPAPNAFDVACDFTNVTADYLPPLEPIRAAAGAARLTGERLDVTVRAGAIGACRVDGGTLGMDLTVDPPRAEIAADVSGATSDVLTLVARPPIAFVPPLGIAAKDVGGESRVHAELRLPIATRIAASAVNVRATAALTGATLPPLAAGVGLRDGRLDVRVDGSTVEVQGTTALTNLPALTTPVTLALTVAPDPGDGARRAGDGARRASDGARRAGDGARRASDGARRASDGALRATLALDAEGLLARGSASFSAAGIATLVVDRLRFLGSDLAGTLSRRPDGGYEASLTGPSLDLASLLAGRPPGASEAPAFTARYGVSLRLDRVRTTGDLEVRNLRGAVQGAGERLGGLTLEGTLPPRGDFQATLAAGTGRRRVTVTSSEAGRLLQAVVGLEQVVGGTLALEATTDERGPLAALTGELVLRDFKVVRAPVLAKILGIGSLGGIAALVQSEGMPVTEARVPFAWDGGRLTLHDVRAIGAIGVIADGTIDRTSGTCDLRGNVIPAYTLNSALGKVPLLGRLFVAKGEGVFGINYRVSGAIANPTVRVNPLRSVAPTVLRQWFVDPFTRGDRGAPHRPRP